MAGALAGKVAVITGVGSETSIGGVAASLFHKEGASIVLSYHSGHESKVGSSLRGRTVACKVDVRKSDQVERLIRSALGAFGGIDILCNVAGSPGQKSRVAETPEDVFDAVIDVNLRGTFLTMKAVIPHMLERGGGSIINIASTAALIGVPTLGAYSAAKAAVVGLSKVAAVEYGADKIRTNVICPGVIKTPMYDAAAAGNSDLIEYLTGLIPMGRVGTPAEVAEAMLYLASDRSSYVNGVVLPVEGGQTIA